MGGDTRRQLWNNVEFITTGIGHVSQLNTLRETVPHEGPVALLTVVDSARTTCNCHDKQRPV